MNYLDVVIDKIINNFDFDCMWYKSLKFTQISDDNYQITYQVGATIHKINIKIKYQNGKFVHQRILKQ